MNLVAVDRKYLFLQLLKTQRITEPIPEYRFHDVRRWRFDFAWPESRVALEVEGGVWTGGRHTRGAGFSKDMAKYNEAASMGWIIIRCTPSDLCKLDTVRCVASAMRNR